MTRLIQVPIFSVSFPSRRDLGMISLSMKLRPLFLYTPISHTYKYILNRWLTDGVNQAQDAISSRGLVAALSITGFVSFQRRPVLHPCTVSHVAGWVAWSPGRLFVSYNNLQSAQSLDKHTKGLIFLELLCPSGS